MARADPTDPVVAATARTEFEAEAIASALRARSITCHVFGGVLGGYRAEDPSVVKVMVRRADLDEARAILERIREESREIEWSEVDLSVPDHPGEAKKIEEEKERSIIRRSVHTAALIAIAGGVMIIVGLGVSLKTIPYPMDVIAVVLILSGLVMESAVYMMSDGADRTGA